jgi:hypothetical protein
MSAFDVAIACTTGMLECLHQNFWVTPPYGAVPDATMKLQQAVMGMLDALQIARSAERAGAQMPPLPEQSEGGAVVETSGHSLHVRQVEAHAQALTDAPPEPPPEPVPQQPVNTFATSPREES